MNRPTAAALLALALAVPAAAVADGPGGARTYPLRTFLNHHLKKGERAHEHSVERDHHKQAVLNRGQPFNQKDLTSGVVFNRTEAIQAVDAKGRPSRILYTFETFKDLRTGASPDVKGLQVLVKKGPNGEWTVTGQGKAKVPPALARYLDKSPTNEVDGKDDLAMRDALLPAKPVAIGTTWTPDAEGIVKAMAMPNTELASEGSSTKGTFRALSKKPGWVEGKVTAHLVFQRFNGVRTNGNLSMDIAMTLQRPKTDSLPARAVLLLTTQGTFHPPGAPAGVSVSLDMRNESRLQRGPVGK